MKPASKHDVIVIGGGPAGSTAAALLARYGHDVLLLEKERFPREHVGESMLPFCYPLFAELGVLDELRRHFVRKPGVRFIDRHGSSSTTWCFAHVIKDPSYLSFHVLRSEFDTILLKNAARLGATVREEVRVTDVDIATSSERVWVRSAAGEKEEVHEARFVIDASGRDAFIASRNGWREPREELDRTALWSHWAGVKLRGGLEEGLSLIVYIGEEKKGWIWIFPLGADRVTAGVVMQNSYLRSERRRLLDNGSSDWAHDLCVQELSMSTFVEELLAGAHRTLPVMINGDYSYEVQHHYGSNYAMIGDARGFIDPIFSSGVFLSIKSAFLVAPPLHAQLESCSAGENQGLAHAYEQITGAYAFVHRMIRLFYNPHAITWAEVGAAGQVHKRHESALATGHYMLSGDFFENYEKYNKFFELLEDPRKFEWYAQLVLDRTPRKTTCDARWEDIFGQMATRDAERHDEDTSEQSERRR